jgi:maltose O-acetyltransferase
MDVARVIAIDDGPSLMSRAYPLHFRSKLNRLARAALGEIEFDARKVFGSVVSELLPHLAFQRARTALLRSAGFRIGARSMFLGTLHTTGPGPISLLSIGEDTIVTGPLHVDLGAKVTIGNRVQIGLDVSLLTLDHEIGPTERRCGPLLSAPIVIEDGVWIASRVMILPGVTIGRGSIVAAGAVVAHDVPADTLVGGVPARPVRDLTHEAPPSSRRQRAQSGSPNGVSYG